MVNLRQNREALVFAHDGGDINDEEFILLYDLNRSTNLDLSYIFKTNQCLKYQNKLQKLT